MHALHSALIVSVVCLGNVLCVVKHKCLCVLVAMQEGKAHAAAARLAPAKVQMLVGQLMAAHSQGFLSKVSLSFKHEPSLSH